MLLSEAASSRGKGKCSDDYNIDLRVMTYNIKQGLPLTKDGTEQEIFANIFNKKPDIIAF